MTKRAAKKSMTIKDPLVIIFENGERTQYHIAMPDGSTYQSYGLIVCDLVRHVAKAFNVDESAVWAWVELERSMPTTDITQHS